MDLKDLSALELSTAIKKGEAGVEEAVKVSLEQIKKSEDTVHAFLETDEEKVYQRVKEVEAGIASGKYLFLKLSASVISKETGVDILTVNFKNSESAVAEAPIIWFITSQIALLLISSSSNLSSGTSSPRRVPTMMRTSFLLNIIILLPSRPST